MRKSAIPRSPGRPSPSSADLALSRQASYASVDAIRKRRELLVRTLAAYAKVYRFVSGPESNDAFRRAREKVTGRNEEHEASTQWSWIQANQPYAKDLVLSDDQI